MSIIKKENIVTKASDIITAAIKSGYKIIPNYSYNRTAPSYSIMITKLLNENTNNELFISTIDYHSRYRLSCRLSHNEEVLFHTKLEYYNVHNDVFSDSLDEANKLKDQYILNNNNFKFNCLNDYIKLNDSDKSINCSNYNVKSRFDKLSDYIK